MKKIHFHLKAFTFVENFVADAMKLKQPKKWDKNRIQFGIHRGLKLEEVVISTNQVTYSISTRLTSVNANGTLFWFISSICGKKKIILAHLLSMKSFFLFGRLYGLKLVESCQSCFFLTLKTTNLEKCFKRHIKEKVFSFIYETGQIDFQRNFHQVI